MGCGAELRVQLCEMVGLQEWAELLAFLMRGRKLEMEW